MTFNTILCQKYYYNVFATAYNPVWLNELLKKYEDMNNTGTLQYCVITCRWFLRNIFQSKGPSTENTVGRNEID